MMAMLELPDDFAPEAFVGREIELICFGGNAINIHFDADIVIQLYGPFVHSLTPDLKDGAEAEVPVAESKLMQLVGATVQTATTPDRHTLVLRFSNGQALSCYADESPYESVRLEVNGRAVFL